MLRRHLIHTFALAVLIASQFSCKTIQPTPAKATWLTDIQTSPVFAQSHTGFALYDLEKGQTVAEHQSDHYFTPASNTKLFSFYAGLRTLGDSIPALRYVQKGDSLIFWGTGDPSLLYPNLPSTKALDFLRSRQEKLFFSASNFFDNPYGAGWQWDDYNGSYQPEVSPLPIYGNVLTFKTKQNGYLEVLPAYGWRFTRVEGSESKRFGVLRDFDENIFRYAPSRIRAGYEQSVPFRTSAVLTAALLSDTLKRVVTVINKSFRSTENPNYLYSVPADTLYKRMLQPSDNMLAEHLLMLVSSKIGDSLSVEKAIDYATKHYLNDLPDAPVWADGSGLSRYNLFTPRSIVALLQKIYQKVPQKRLFELLAIGGQTGTLKNIYKSEKPFVFGKTGTVSNCHNLSGYLLTSSGKVLIFSFMNNNFVRPTADIRKEMERILTQIHLNYN